MPARKRKVGRAEAMWLRFSCLVARCALTASIRLIVRKPSKQFALCLIRIRDDARDALNRLRSRGTLSQKDDLPSARLKPGRTAENMMPVETELKFRMPARDMGALAKGRFPRLRKDRAERARLLSTYFDTAKHTLKRHGLTLRIRKEQGKNFQTVKSDAYGSIGRGEWEAERRPDPNQTFAAPLIVPCDCLARRSCGGNSSRSSRLR